MAEKTPARKTAAQSTRRSRLASPSNGRSVIPWSEDERWEMPKALLAIVDEHHYVFRLLPMLEAEAENLGDQQPVNFDCLEGVMHYLIHYPDQFHHPREDLIFERMADRKAEIRETVTQLKHDHEKMAGNGQAIYERILAQRDRIDRRRTGKLASDILGYAKALRSHMQREEAEVLQPAWHCLTEAEWEVIDSATRTVDDPIFGDQIAARYVSLMQRYIGEFTSVSTTGSFPIRLIEAAAGSIEKTAYTVDQLNRLPRRLIRTSWDIYRQRLKRFGNLACVRSLPELGSWTMDTSTEYVNDWKRLTREVTKTLSYMGQAVSNEESFVDPFTVALNTEEQLLSYQEAPYLPDENPRTSWQAAMTNIAMRVMHKPMMEHLPRLAKVNPKTAEFEPPGTLVRQEHNSQFHATWLIPEDLPTTSRTILHLHGGGFFTPASEMHMTMVAKMAQKCGARGLLLHYRLLPDHPFPAGLEDAVAAYRFLLAEGVAPEEILVTGDSAGGNLALALLMSLREEGLPMPAAGAVMSPCTDLTFSTRARSINRWRDALLPGLIKKKDVYEDYAGELSVEDPLISPIFGNYRDFPPMFAIVSSSETLLDDTLVVARKARAQGVDFDVEVWASLPHVWPLFDFLPEAEYALDHMAAFIQRQFSLADQVPRRRRPNPARKKDLAAAT